MPCTAKKFEIGREDENGAGVPDVDIAITTRELGTHDRTRKHSFYSIFRMKTLMMPLGLSNRCSSHLRRNRRCYGSSSSYRSGDTDRRRTCKSGVYRCTWYQRASKKLIYNVAGMDVQVAVASGLEQCKRTVWSRVKSGEAEYHFIEDHGMSWRMCQRWRSAAGSR